MSGDFFYNYIPDMVSIILLSYNSGEYLFEAIDSIVEQNYSSIELIVADDGSTNFDEAHIKNYIETTKRDNLQYSIIHREKNIGTVKNINYALARTHGEFIRILGGDDTYPIPNVLSEMISVLKKSDALAIVGKLEQCNATMTPIFDKRVEKANNALPSILKMDYIEGRRYIAKKDIFPIANQAVCYRRNFFEISGFCNENYILIEDIDLANRLLAKNKKVLFYNGVAVKHRAKVGISTSRELFAPRRLLYYKDCITYAEKDIAVHPEIFNFVYRIEQVRLSNFVYKMAKAKADEKGKWRQVQIMICYIDTMTYYVLSNTKKFVRRMKERIG